MKTRVTEDFLEKVEFKLMFQGPSLVAHMVESSCSVRDPGLTPGSRRPLEKDMATHSSILALKIPWTEEPAPLSMGSQGVRHN